MHKLRCRWIILIAVLIGALTVALGIFGLLKNIDTLFYLLIAFSVLALILAAAYSFRRDSSRLDLRCLTYGAFTTLAAAVLGVVTDVLLFLEIPFLFTAAAAFIIVFWSAVRVFQVLIQRGSGGR